MPVTDLYARKSSKDAGRSVARQERMWRADCAAEGLTPGLVFVDPDLSASRYSTKGRPDYEALLEHVRNKRCEVISMWETSRGSREMGEWVDFLDLIRKNGVLLRIFDPENAETYDSRRPKDRAALLNQGVNNELEVEKTRGRSRAGTADAASEGRPPGPMPDGYRRIYHAPSSDSVSITGATRRQAIEQVIDEPRAQLYRWAAEGVLNGVPPSFIARVLNAWKIPTPTGDKQWFGGVLTDRLLLPSMEGHRVLGGVIVSRNAWPAILDPETAARLRAWREAPLPSRNTADRRLKYMLSGVMLCQPCGQASMSGRTFSDKSAKSPRYQCDPKRGGCGRLSARVGVVDELVSEQVVARLRQPDGLAVFAPVDDDSELVMAQQDLDALTGRRDELYASAANPGGPSIALVAATERELLPRIDAATKRVRALRTPRVLREYDPLDLARNWSSHPVGDRRAVVMALASVVLSPAPPVRRWSPDRLGLSRWHGDALTWGERWARR